MFKLVQELDNDLQNKQNISFNSFPDVQNPNLQKSCYKLGYVKRIGLMIFTLSVTNGKM